MSEDNAPPEEEEDDQAWLATFADLMSLLMCFFVLLLSFSEMDLDKYKQIAGSMKKAFGVQRQIEADSAPKGTSLITREFSPGIPTPSPLPMMQQVAKPDDAKERNKREQKKTYDALSKALSEEITRRMVEVLRINNEIIVRIRENESFESGSAEMRASIYPILDSIVGAMSETEGALVVGGHTDNVPISTRIFPSNWVLSAARAANVVHYLSTTDQLDGKQIEIRAYGDSRPVTDNNTTANRTVNRRVEIIVTPPMETSTADNENSANERGNVADNGASENFPPLGPDALEGSVDDGFPNTISDISDLE